MPRLAHVVSLALLIACAPVDSDHASAGRSGIPGPGDTTAALGDSAATVNAVRDYVRALIDAVEDYRSEHERIPDDLVVFGLQPPDSVPPAVLEISGGHYTVSASHPRGFTCSANSDSLTVRCKPSGGCCGR